MENKKPNENVFKELKKYQLLDVDEDKKLEDWDFLRISKNLDESIFTSKNCVLWKGFVSNIGSTTKGTYVNFTFNYKKYALHRLLYLNYVGKIYEGEYVRYTCDRKGECCNINHFEKISSMDNNTRQILSKKRLDKEQKDFIIEFE